MATINLAKTLTEYRSGRYDVPVLTDPKELVDIHSQALRLDRNGQDVTAEMIGTLGQEWHLALASNLTAEGKRRTQEAANETFRAIVSYQDLPTDKGMKKVEGWVQHLQMIVREFTCR